MRSVANDDLLVPCPARAYGSRRWNRCAATRRPIDRDCCACGATRSRSTSPEATSELIVTADMPYSRLGEGMHRFLDPADGEAYIWSESVVNNARRVFGCF